MVGFFRHVHLERRRLVFAALLGFLAGNVLFAQVEARPFGLPAPIFAGLLYVVFVAPSAAVTSYFFPGMRRLIDGVAVARLCFAILVTLLHAQAYVTSPFVSATAVVGGAALLLRASALADRLAQRSAAPDLLIRVTTQGRSVLAWIDNAAARQQGMPVAVVAPDMDGQLAAA